jgi:hypothetical protein
VKKNPSVLHQPAYLLGYAYDLPSSRAFSVSDHGSFAMVKLRNLNSKQYVDNLALLLTIE